KLESLPPPKDDVVEAAARRVEALLLVPVGLEARIFDQPAIDRAARIDAVVLAGVDDDQLGRLIEDPRGARVRVAAQRRLGERRLVETKGVEDRRVALPAGHADVAEHRPLAGPELAGEVATERGAGLRAHDVAPGPA